MRYLERCKTVLNPDGGVIVLKENLSTSDKDLFDDVDSSVTRYVETYRSESSPNLSPSGKMRSSRAFFSKLG